MKMETFFEKFDLFAEAPDAVARMRELVLELAIQGKLVAQCSDDEPALKQLERIAAKKSKTGRIAREKAARNGSSAAEETETHVPGGWAKTSLAELVTVLNGRAYSKDELLAAGTPVLRVGNLFTSKHWYYSDLELEPDKYCDKGDLIFAWSASFGPFIWSGPKVIYHYHIWKLELNSEADLHKGYLYWFLQNKTQEIKRAGHGVSMLHMTKEKMEKLEVMLPPLAEQKRIVAKVDELMALCVRLEAQQQAREAQHAALARASLAHFAEAPTPANLDLLFHKSYAIPPANLRKSILTLAVQGKLVPQAPNDEPVNEFLGVPQKAERKNPKWAGPIERKEKPFLLPPSWKWLRLGDVSGLKHGYAFSSKYFTSEPAPFVLTTPGNFFEKGGFRDRESKRKYYSGPVDPEFVFEPGDLIIPMTEQAAGLLGSPAFIPDDGRVYIHNQRLGKLKFSKEIAPEFAFWFFNSDYFRGELARTCTGMKVRHTSPDRILRVLFPVCPLAEQRRIVAKVDELMALVDALESQLATVRTTAKNLLAAVVTELTRTQVEADARIQPQGNVQ